ncbi:MAG: hypothetical protein IKU57_01770 [Oscillospiraceae bacterium]|nr:hypothetical protein [Oscillospiraceae bacterium]
MYPVSNAFMEAIESNTRKYFWTGTITTTNGIRYSFENKDIVKGSGYITRQCCGSTEIELGTVYAAELGISLFSDIDRYTLEGAEVKLFFHLYLADGTVESIPMGVFEVSEANRNIKTLELKAYDYMLRFDKALSLNATSGTAFNYLMAACTACKVELAQTQTEIEKLPNGRETLGVYAENDMETYRDLLFYVGQVLGCVCLINREGKLQLVPYSDTAVMTVPQKERFTSSYSDFVTRYTAVSSTNQLREVAEYYALETDDALTMNLGINPLLQFGLAATRERILTAILNAIAKVEYVPFDSSTIGNPALDPMDILQFTGGHADATKVSCITSITYNINGKQHLKCVGKNPKLSSAKSKNEKNIVGLLNQVENNKTVVYSFMNVSPFSIGSSSTEVLSITFTAKESTSAMFLGEFLLDVVAEDIERIVEGTAVYTEEGTDGVVDKEHAVTFTFTEKSKPVLTVTYKSNGETVDTFIPQMTCVEGKHILTLFYPMSAIIENSENTFDVYLSMEGGTVNIGESQIRATISGQGLVAGIGDWNGRIAINDVITRIGIADVAFGHTAISDRAAVIHPWLDYHGVTQAIARIAIEDVAFGYDVLNERITATEVIKTFTIDAEYPPHYNMTLVGLNADDAFVMVCDYAVVSAEEEIDHGRMQHLTVDTTPYERVESLEVVLC